MVELPKDRVTVRGARLVSGVDACVDVHLDPLAGLVRANIYFKKNIGRGACGTSHLIQMADFGSSALNEAKVRYEDIIALQKYGSSLSDHLFRRELFHWLSRKAFLSAFNYLTIQLEETSEGLMVSFVEIGLKHSGLYLHPVDGFEDGLCQFKDYFEPLGGIHS